MAASCNLRAHCETRSRKTRRLDTRETRNVQRSSPGRHAQGRVHSYIRRSAEELVDGGAVLWRVGDLSPQGFAGRSEADLCLAVERLAWAGDAAVGRWWQDVAADRQPVRIRRRSR